ncbi:MAG: hypothetical protein AB7F86_02765 [Bdellovibrionales bacterium]
MNQNTQLKLRSFPKAIGDLAHSNQFLKMSAFASYGLCTFLIALLTYQSFRPLTVLTLTPEGSAYQSGPLPRPELEIERAVREYLKYRYNWDAKNISSQLAEAGAFILPSTRKPFEVSMKKVMKFAAEKMVAQRAYPEKVQIDLKAGVALVQGDRITAIQGLRAAGDLKLELTVVPGPRTSANPWGVYISKEKEEQQ